MAMQLSDYMRKTGLSDQELAERIGISLSYAVKLRRGDKKPSLDIAYKIQTETGGSVTLKDWVKANPTDLRDRVA